MAFDLIGVSKHPDVVLGDRCQNGTGFCVLDRWRQSLSAGFHRRNTPADVIRDASLVLRLVSEPSSLRNGL